MIDKPKLFYSHRNYLKYQGEYYIVGLNGFKIKSGIWTGNRKARKEDNGIQIRH